jgi:hypothetical protein
VTLSDQRVAVSVPESGSKDVLVVLNAPDQASRVMQMPEKSPPDTPAADTPPAEMDLASKPEPTGEPAGEPLAKGTAGPDAPAIAAREPSSPVGKEPSPEAVPQMATEPPIAAETPPASSDEPPVVSATPPAATEPPASDTAPAEPIIQPEVTIAAVEADTAGGLFIAGTAATTDLVRIYLDGVLVGEAEPTENGTWLLETVRELRPGNYRIRADQVGAGGEVIVRAEVPFEREVEVALLKPTGSAGAATGTRISGAMPEMSTVIIKRGDNLWRLSRSMYGKGIRWSTLYEANRDQIRNPRWIFPGQVFVVPKGDTRWTE